jgi:hypothetical protein
MDMKKILQALDTASSKPVEGSNSMKKFMSIVTEGNNRQSIAEQMIVKEYSTSAAKKGNGVIHKYINEVLKESEEKVLEKKARAAVTAKRVLARMEEAKQTEAPKPRNFVAKNAKTAGAGAHKDKKKAEKQGNVKHKNKALDMAEGAGFRDVSNWSSRDIQKLGHEDDTAQSDTWKVYIDGKFWKTFHNETAALRAANTIEQKHGKKTTVRNESVDEGILGDIFGSGTNDQIEQLKAMLANPKYNTNPQWKAQLEKRLKIAQDRQDLDHGMAVDKRGEPIKVLPPDQYKGNLDEGDEDPCWADYKMVGTKKKGGKTVPNCVPKKKG